MLCLQRKRDESVMFFLGNTSIEVKVLKTEPGRITLGVDAPQQVKIIRKELLDDSGKES